MQAVRGFSDDAMEVPEMLRRVLLAVVLAVSPTLSYASPKEDAQAVFDKFLTA